MNEGERRLIHYQQGLMDPNSFYGSLMRAIFKADLRNLAKLSQGFPDEVKAVRRWRTKDGYAEKLREEYERGRQ